jgi:hypothetical protein
MEVGNPTLTVKTARQVMGQPYQTATSVMMLPMGEGQLFSQ